MRAIISCRSNQSKEHFKETLEELGWWPEPSQDDPVTQKHKDEIIRLISPEDVELVKATAWYVIYKHDSAKTWGLVNSPSHGIIEIRLKNPSPVELRSAVEIFIDQIQKSPNGPNYIFRDLIEVMEPNSLHRAFFGEPLPTRPGQKLELARQERSWEWKAGSWFILASIAFMFLSTPFVMSLFPQSFSEDWIRWTEGVIGRLATSAFVSGSTFYLTVVWHYQELRRFGAVRWRLETKGRFLSR